MALMASAVANGGVMPQPRIVSEVRDSQGRVAREFPVRTVRRAISGSSAADLTQMMIAVVNNGSGYRAAIPGIQVAGKTGTATNGEGRAPNAWFTAFAPAAGPADRGLGYRPRRREPGQRSHRRPGRSPHRAFGDRGVPPVGKGEARSGMEQVFGDRYEVQGRIGVGGMAEVWRGHDRTLNRTVAIKTLLPQFARDASFVDRFRREAQAAARLNHPGIVSVYDSGTDGETPYIVMQFIEGRTLADYLASGKTIPPMKAAQVAKEIAEALAAAHAEGVIHRDIKPANVMVTRDGKVLVMDFGIARLISGPETAPQTSAVLGTASYLSPEQAQGQSVDARTDIYALGVVLYEMLTGRPPFTGDSPMAIAYKQVNATPEAPSSVNPDVPPELDAVVMRALSKNPANRYQTGQEFADDLERARTGGQVMATPLLPATGEATQVISRPQPTSVLPPQQDEPGRLAESVDRSPARDLDHGPARRRRVPDRHDAHRRRRRRARPGAQPHRSHQGGGGAEAGRCGSRPGGIQEAADGSGPPGAGPRTGSAPPTGR